MENRLIKETTIKRTCDRLLSENDVEKTAKEYGIQIDVYFDSLMHALFQFCAENSHTGNYNGAEKWIRREIERRMENKDDKAGKAKFIEFLRNLIETPYARNEICRNPYLIGMYNDGPISVLCKALNRLKEVMESSKSVYTRRQIKEAIQYWSRMLNEDIAVKTQEELQDFCDNQLSCQWEDVIKVASCEIIRKPEEGEEIDTITWNDEKNDFETETRKKAKADDWLIKNHYDSNAKAEKDKSVWLIDKNKLAKNYQEVNVNKIKAGDVYKPKPVPRKGMKLPNGIKDFWFELPASWSKKGEPPKTMLARGGDWLINDNGEIYRIAELIFDLTYKKGKSVNESKKYTRSQIREVISYWKNQLRTMNEF